MRRERTLVIIKPDAVERNLVGSIVRHIERSGINVKAIKMTKLAVETGRRLYAEHKEKPFYNDLIEYMTSNAIAALIVEGEDGIKRVREIIGNTDPVKACEGSIRKLYAISKQKNAVHASGTRQQAYQELECIFH
ncbi:MAG: nucleoside-diphosphate kinase [Pseudomonadota bacterium]